MNKHLFIIAAMAVAFTSCQKEEEVMDNAASLRFGEICGDEASTALMAGQHHLAGNVTVSNDADYLYVTYNATGNWRIKKTHLYVGPCAGIPTTGSGNPKIGHFPYTADHNRPSVTTYTYAIALNDLDACGCVAAHAEVVRLNGGGTVVQSETAWGSGTGIGGNSWAMKFDYCAQECEDVVDPS